MSIEVTGYPLEGMERARQKLERAAQRLLPAGKGTEEGEANMAAAMVEAIEAVNLYKANAQMVKAEDELRKQIVDLLA